MSDSISEEDHGPYILLEDFSAPRFPWKLHTDEISGGNSKGSFQVSTTKGLQFHGEINAVEIKELSVPGSVFLEAEIGKEDDQTLIFPNVEGCEGLEIVGTDDDPNNMDHTMPNMIYYVGFLDSRADIDLESHGFGYRAFLRLPPTPTNDNDTDQPSVTAAVRIPFSQFSSVWVKGVEENGEGGVNPKPGEVVCDPDFDCPGVYSLQHMNKVAFTATQREGHFGLTIRSIGAYNCKEGHPPTETPRTKGTTTTKTPIRKKSPPHHPAAVASSVVEELDSRGGTVLIVCAAGMILSLLVGWIVRRKRRESSLSHNAHTLIPTSEIEIT